MQRREFLFTAGAAAVAGLANGTRVRAQAPKQARQSTLDRMAIMTLNFQRMLKVPDVQDSPERTLELFDLPEMLADKYGVHKIEFQHYHIPSTEPAYLKELRGRIEKSKSRMTQINLEFSGLNISAPQQRDRLLAIDLTKMWVNHAAMLGAQRVMINQGAPTHENKVNAIPALKAMADYGRSKNIIVSVETRGSGGGNRGRGAGRGNAPGASPGAPAAIAPAPAAATPSGATAPSAAAPGAAASPAPGATQPAAPVSGPPPAPPMPQPQVWALLAEIIKGAGAYSNVDLGGAGAANQEELHQCLKLMFPMTAGSLHTRVNTNWDLATAIKFLEHDLGYKGLYTIEASNAHEGTQQIYDVVVATL
jgi:hypothetical protein